MDLNVVARGARLAWQLPGHWVCPALFTETQNEAPAMVSIKAVVVSQCALVYGGGSGWVEGRE